MIGQRNICLTLSLPSRQKKKAATATVENRRNNGCLPIYASIPKSFAPVRGKPDGWPTQARFWLEWGFPHATDLGR